MIFLLLKTYTMVKISSKQSDFQLTQKLVKWQCLHLVTHWFDKVFHLQTLANIWKLDSDFLTRFSQLWPRQSRRCSLLARHCGCSRQSWTHRLFNSIAWRCWNWWGTGLIHHKFQDLTRSLQFDGFFFLARYPMLYTRPLLTVRECEIMSFSSAQANFTQVSWGSAKVLRHRLSSNLIFFTRFLLWKAI